MTARWTAFFVILGLGSLPAGPASSAPAPTRSAPLKSEGKPPPKADLERWGRALESGQESEKLAALREITALGARGASAAPLIEKLLQKGSSVAVTLAALGAAGSLEATSLSTAVGPYIRHRNSEIRQAAATSLAQTRGSVAVQALRGALHGPDAKVRGIAARGLGTLGATEAVDDLFSALELDTAEAALSIALLCGPDQCDRLMALVGKLRFEVLEPGFLPLLLRPEASLPKANKLRYIARLRRLATRRATVVLETALAQLPEDADPELVAALKNALRARPVGGK